jgi:purine-binding chemotaxis protein CheW
MTTEWQQRRAELASAFDAAFAAPPPPPRAGLVRLIGIRAGESAYVLRLAELAGLAPVPVIVALPDSRPGLLGLAGLRGRMVAVFDLAVLLGHPPSGALRWLALPADGDAVAVAFDELEAHHLAPQTALLPADGPATAIAEMFTFDGAMRPVIDLPALLRPLTHAPSTQEFPS